MGSFVLRFIYAASATENSNSRSGCWENSEEIVMRSCSLELTRQGTYATLEPSRVTAARLLEFSIQIYY